MDTDIKRKENVLIVHNYYQIPGGEDTVVANEKKMLEDHGHKVILYTRNNSELKEMSKFQKLKLPFTTIFNPRTYKDIKRIIRKENIDVVHVHNTLNLISPAVYYAARSMRIPVVQTVHNFRFVCPGATFYRDGHICEDCVRNGLKTAVKYGCYRKSKLQTLACVVTLKFHSLTNIYHKINYICLTDFTKQKLESFTKEAKVFIKPNFVYDIGLKDAYDYYYLFVGRVEEIKGINILIDAFKNMPDKKLKIAGQGDLDDLIKNKVIKEHLNNIELLGYQNRESVNRLLKNAKALIMCSQWYETFGMVIAEAYSCGTPVIVGNIGNIKELVLPGKTGELFCYNSYEKLIEAIKIFEKNDYHTYSLNAYDFFKNRLNAELNYMQLIKIYKNIVK